MPSARAPLTDCQLQEVVLTEVLRLLQKARYAPKLDEDAVMEAGEKALSHLADLGDRSESGVRNYLSVVLKHVGIDQWRENTRQRELGVLADLDVCGEQAARAAGDPAQVVCHTEFLREFLLTLEQVVNDLPLDEASAFVQRWFQHKRHARISPQLGVDDKESSRKCLKLRANVLATVLRRMGSDQADALAFMFPWKRG